MAALIELDEALADLRIESGAEDVDVVGKIAAAHGIVMKYVKYPVIEELRSEDVDVLRIAEILVLRNLFDEQNSDPLTDGVKAILHGYRDPTLA